MLDKHKINHLQKKQPLHQGKAVPSHVSTQPDPSNITGHSVLIFHSFEYRLAFNRIYTKLSMFQGGLPSPCSAAGILSPLQEDTLETWLPLAAVVTFCLREKTWKMTIMAKMKFALAAFWTKTKRSRGESEALSLFIILKKLKMSTGNIKLSAVVLDHVLHLSVLWITAVFIKNLIRSCQNATKRTSHLG